jgi:tetratricopeptide (TPR) repeat protein
MRKLFLITILLLGLVLPAKAEFTPKISWNYRAPDILYNISISKDGKRVSASSRDGSIYLLDGRGNLLNKYTIGHDITALSLSGDGLYLVAKTRDLLYLFGEDLKLLGNYKMKDWIEDICLSEEGKFIACASRDNYLYLLNNKGEILWKYRVAYRPKAVAIDASGEFVAAGSEGYIYFLDGQGRLVSKYETDEEIKSIALNDSGENIVGASQNWLYFLSKDGKLLWKRLIDDEVKTVSLSGDGKYISLGSITGNVYLFNQIGQLLWKYRMGKCIWRVALTRNGENLAVAPWDSSIYFIETRVREKSPPLLEAHLARGHDYLNKGQFEDAIIEFLEVLSLSPENSKAIEGIERARALSKELRRKKIVRKLPPVEIAPTVLGENVEKLEVTKIEEFPAIQEVRLRHPFPVTLLIFLSLILLGFTLTLIYQKKYDRISKRHNSLLTYHRNCGYLPENKDLVNMLANLYKEEGIFDSTSALAYEKAEMFAEAGLSYHNSKDLRKAAEMYEKKSSLEGDDYDILQRLAQIYHDLGQEDRMVNVLRRMVVVIDKPEDLVVLAQLLEKLEDIEGAIKAYEKLILLDKQTPEYQNRLLELYWNNGHRDKFLPLAEELHMRGKLSLDNLPHLARTYVENSIFDKASEIYGKLTQKSPEYRHSLIEALIIQNRIDEALVECEMAPLTNGQELDSLLNLYAKINERRPGDSRVQALIEETYRKAEEQGLEVNLPRLNNEREQIFHPPIINAQEQYSILTEKDSPHSK